MPRVNGHLLLNDLKSACSSCLFGLIYALSLPSASSTESPAVRDPLQTSASALGLYHSWKPIGLSFILHVELHYFFWEDGIELILKIKGNELGETLFLPASGVADFPCAMAVAESSPFSTIAQSQKKIPTWNTSPDSITQLLPKVSKCFRFFNSPSSDNTLPKDP